MNRIHLIIGLTLIFATPGAFSGLEQEFFGKTWVDHSWGMLDLELTSIDLDASGTRILCSSEKVVYLSINKGRSWKIVFRSRTVPFVEEELPQDETIEDFEAEEADEFDRDDFDPEDLIYRGVLDEDEDIDDLSDEELQERLIDFNLIDEVDDDRDDQDDPEEELPPPDEYDGVVIHQVRWDPVNPQYAYLATSDGLYRSMNFGTQWEHLAAVSGSNDIDSICILPSNGSVIIGIDNKLFVSRDHALTFESIQQVSFESEIRNIVADRKTGSRILTAAGSSINVARMEPNFLSEQIITLNSAIRALTIVDPDNVYAVADTSLFHLAGDRNWEAHPVAEIPDVKIHDVIVALNSIILATNRGLYFWNSLSGDGRFFNNGLTDYDIREVAVNPENTQEIWVATGSGVFELAGQESGDESVGAARNLPEDFPALDILSEAALLYAEIDTVRDRSWYDQSAKRSWYPRIDFNCAFFSQNQKFYSRSPVISLSDGVAYTGPVSERFDCWEKDPFAVDIVLTWSPRFAQFDWSQLAMQSRLRSEVKRRNSILENVRNLYSTLQQLYLEKTMQTDRALLMDRILRIQLTEAQLTALTGFVFNPSFHQELLD